MAYRELREALKARRGAVSRTAIADRAVTLPGGTDALTPHRLRMFEDFLESPPDDGEVLRAATAAIGLDWPEALELMGYWPPLPSPYTEPIPETLLREAAKAGGWRVVRASSGYVIYTGE